jgi:hypothetical protein
MLEKLRIAAFYLNDECWKKTAVLLRKDGMNRPLRLRRREHGDWLELWTGLRVLCVSSEAGGSTSLRRIENP